MTNMTGAWIPLLGVLGIVTTGLGFATNRSDPGFLGPSIRPTGPKLKTDHRSSIDMFLSRKIIDSIMGDNEPKISVKGEEKCSSCSEDPMRVGRSDDVARKDNPMTLNDKNNATDIEEPAIVSSKTLEPRNVDVTTEKRQEDGEPRNVVLVLVNDAGSDREAVWKNFEAAHEFAVRGFLQNCRSSDFSEGSKFSLDESLISFARVECECDRLLRANVGSLLSWARHARDMTTGAVSATNFSIPSPLGYEKLPNRVAKDLEDEEMNPQGQDTRRTRPDGRANWRLVELQKQPAPSSSTPNGVPETVTKSDGVNGYDGTWDVFDMFSRIRMAFFRILLESLGNLSGNEDDFLGRRPIPGVQPNVAELVSDTVREMKSGPNDEGLMLVVAAPGSEISTVVDILRTEVSTEDTLLVVAGLCAESNELVPYFASGPGGKALQKARTVWDLPASIRSVINRGCRGEVCKNKRREEPLALPSLELHQFSHDAPRKRIARAKEDDETTSSTGEDKTTKDFVETETEADDKQAEPEKGKRSEGNGADISRVDNVAAILGIATSIVAMLALNS